LRIALGDFPNHRCSEHDFCRRATDRHLRLRAPIGIVFRAWKIRVSATFLCGVEPAAAFAMRRWRKESFD
jgi:hypothetical protein